MKALANTIKNNWINAYNDNKKELFGFNSHIADYAEKALTTFLQTGIPTRKNENYKYTDLLPVLNKDYEFAFKSSLSKNIKVKEIFSCDVPALDTYLIIMLNGHYLASASDSLPNEIEISSVQEALKNNKAEIINYFGKYVSKKDPLTALNGMFANDGLFISVPDNYILDKPIQIVNIAYHDNSDLQIYPHNILIFGKNSDVKLINCDHTLSKNSFFTNSVFEMVIAEAAKLEIYQVQNEHNMSVHISNYFIKQFKESHFKINTTSLHGGFIRNFYHVDLEDVGCNCDIKGLYLTDKGQHIDNFVNVVHKKSNGFSNQLFKGVLDDFATGAFAGKVLVHKDAQKTDAFQRNNSIILTPDAKMNTKPQLEIYADDVKCSHGATVGQLDEEAMFYMQTRGISVKDARMLLMNAFTKEISDTISIAPLRKRITDLVEKRINGELSRCNECPINCY